MIASAVIITDKHHEDVATSLSTAGSDLFSGSTLSGHHFDAPSVTPKAPVLGVEDTKSQNIDQMAVAQLKRDLEASRVLLASKESEITAWQTRHRQLEASMTAPKQSCGHVQGPVHLKVKPPCFLAHCKQLTCGHGIALTP